ncbi:MlaD family protein [Paracoccus sp. S3-43]|uniref:MlaD family protein n=1 Tax=Paracoccus sp. S3-43 TaxID=3030011 RepID=UPI0023B08613|nr:MlaD family protein [Paracoccus sp. S3-43]WEF24538.1 MlaD family protein [Paracoccus sp. S3-43]
METKANYTLIGAFTVLGFLGILGFVLWFAQVELNRRFAYYDVYFPNVSGLGLSSDVLFAGLPVGRVSEMQLAPDNPMPVRVRLEVREDTPIRSDSLAALEVQGVTGVSLVAVSAGSPTAPLLAAGGGPDVPVIASSRSALQTLSDEGPQIIDRLNLVAENLSKLLGEENQARVAAILANVEQSSGNLDQALGDVAAATSAISDGAAAVASFGDQVDGLGQDAGAALERLSNAAAKAEATFETATATLQRIDGFVADDLSPLARRMESTADNLDSALASGSRAFDAVGAVADGDLPQVAGSLRATLAAIDDALASLPDDLPRISASLREASGNAASAFRSLDEVLDDARAPVRAFAQDTLPQISRLAQDMRALMANANQLVSALRRNPAQLLTHPPVPEFRR